MGLATGRRSFVVAVVFAAVLALPSVVVSRFGDDYGQLLAVEGSTSPFKGVFSKYDEFVFSDGDPQHVRALVERGGLPWWSHPRLKIAFFRPLSSALMVMDHALFGRGTFGPHLHSALWYTWRKNDPVDRGGGQACTAAEVEFRPAGEAQARVATGEGRARGAPPGSKVDARLRAPARSVRAAARIGRR